MEVVSEAEEKPDCGNRIPESSAAALEKFIDSKVPRHLRPNFDRDISMIRGGWDAAAAFFRPQIDTDETRIGDRFLIAQAGIIRFLIPYAPHLPASWIEHLMEIGEIKQDGCGAFVPICANPCSSVAQKSVESGQL